MGHGAATIGDRGCNRMGHGAATVWGTGLQPHVLPCAVCMWRAKGGEHEHLWQSSAFSRASMGSPSGRSLRAAPIVLKKSQIITSLSAAPSTPSDASGSASGVGSSGRGGNCSCAGPLGG